MLVVSYRLVVVVVVVIVATDWLSARNSAAKKEQHRSFFHRCCGISFENANANCESVSNGSGEVGGVT